MKTAVGLMSGTSMDGIDIALVYTDGEDQLVHENFPMFFPYDAKFREKLISSLDNAKLIKDRNERPGNLAKIEEELTRLHANAINEFLTKNNLAKNKIDVIGYSGQTVLHRPEIGLTVQIGDGQLLADLTGIDVAYDMRANDMVYGGQGAPLVPIYHKAIARDIKNKFHENGTLVIVNIGGISNVTVIEPEMPLIAFDCGPGNALLDQWMLEKEGKWFDENGKIAMQGKVDNEVLQKYLSSKFFSKNSPKSLDRLDFTLDYVRNLSLENGSRTLAKLTAESILLTSKNCLLPVKLWVICGGGRKNRAIMTELQEGANKISGKVVTAEEVGYNGDFVEAEAFAYLAVRSLKGLALTFPMTTGCKDPVSGGKLARPNIEKGLTS